MAPEYTSDLSARNARLTAALEDARRIIGQQKEEIDTLSAPPLRFGTFIEPGPDGTADVYADGHRTRVSSAVSVTGLQPGQRVVLHPLSSVILAAEAFETCGTVAKVVEQLPDGRVVVTAGSDDLTVVRKAAPLASVTLRASDSVLADLKTGVAFEVVSADETASLLLEEVPLTSYADIGGMTAQVEEIRDAVELPFLHPGLYARYQLHPPKGVLLYGPPGCGKTLIARAVASSLAREKGGRAWFINIKGPELLSKFVGETERKIREIFATARDKAAPENPVIIFFDEMESMFRTRGSGISSDTEATIVPQLLAEIDGVAETSNVIVIGATNRQDLIDPAVLRPGRLDVKIQVPRPDAAAAREILGLYLHKDLPYDSQRLDLPCQLPFLIDEVVTRLYAEDKDSEFVEVTYVNGTREIMHFRDFTSGAMIQNIVSRAKKTAIKDELAGSTCPGISLSHLLKAVASEFRETEDLPNTTNPDDWARISGKKGERIAVVRPLLKKDADEIETVDTGQYL